MSAIAAISTPNAPGGIAVIRISGDTALEIADRVFQSVSGKKAVNMSGYTCSYGTAFDGDERLDDCILTVLKLQTATQAKMLRSFHVMADFTLLREF